jgi:phosphoglycerate dehydrogenase-like enzyme
MFQSAIICDRGAADHDLNRVFSPRQMARLKAQTRLFPHVITRANFEEFAPQLQEIEVVFSTWGMWHLSDSQLKALSNLKAVFYAAGSVKHFAAPLLERDVALSSAQGINAIPVAEFTLGQILLANKGYFRNVDEYRETPSYGVFRGRGNFGAQVSILGAGQIGWRLAKLLRSFQVKVLVFDPFLSYKGAELLGVEKVVCLEEAFARGDVISNHLADVPETVKMLRGEHFTLMPRNATFINTGRGGTVDHDGLLQVLRTRPDLTALLDVTDPEPLPLDHPLRDLSNVQLSAHIAGSIGDEVERMGEFAIDEFDRWSRGEPLQAPITLAMLETMA